MASIKTSTSVSVSAGPGASKKPSTGPGPGASAGMVSTTPPAPKPPKAPTAPKTPIAKADELEKNTIDYAKVNAQPAQKPAANTLDYSKVNQIKEKPQAPTLDYAKVNAKAPQPEAKTIDYKSMQSPKPWSGSVDKASAVNAKIDQEANQPALDALKARRMFRGKYLNEAQPSVTNAKPEMKKEETAPAPSQPPSESKPPLSGQGSQDNVAKMKAGMDNQPGALATIAGMFKNEKAKSLKEYATMKKLGIEISKSEREFIREDLGRPYSPYFNDVDVLVKREFQPLEAEILLDVATRLEKGEIKPGELSKADPLDKYKIDKGGSLKFGTSVPEVGFPRNTLDSKKNAKAGSDEGSGGQISKAGIVPTKPAAAPGMTAPKAPAPAAPKMPAMPKMSKAEIQAECNEEFKPKFKK